MTKNRFLVVVLLIGLISLLTACQLDTLIGYNVSGKVTDANGTGIAGVKMSFSTMSATCMTGNDGSWSMTGLKGSIVVTPTKEGFTFTPATKTVTGAESNVNFTATPVALSTYSVEGKVTDLSGAGIEGVTITFDTLEQTCQTMVDGSWTMSGLSGTVILTPIKEGYIFTPATLTVTGEAVNVDFTADLTDEMKIKNVIVKYAEYLENNNVEALVALYDDSYFSIDGQYATREEMISDLENQLSYYAYHFENLTFLDVSFELGVGQVSVRMDLMITDLEEDKPFPFAPYMLFDLVKRDSQWLISGDRPYSPEESIIQEKIQTFLDALQNEDLEAIRPLVSDTARVDYGTYDEFVANWTEVLASMDIVIFNFDETYISRQANNNITSMYGDAVVTVNGVEETKGLSFWFSFEEFDGDWLITVVYLDGLRN